MGLARKAVGSIIKLELNTCPVCMATTFTDDLVLMFASERDPVFVCSGRGFTLGGKNWKNRKQN